MIKYLLDNWKTTAAGLTLVIGSLVHLIFTVRAGTADEAVWTASFTGILTGCGLIFARDASAAKSDHAESQQMISKLAEKVDANKDALVTGDTSMIQKSPSASEEVAQVKKG